MVVLPQTWCKLLTLRIEPFRTTAPLKLSRPPSAPTVVSVRSQTSSSSMSVSSGVCRCCMPLSAFSDPLSPPTSSRRDSTPRVRRSSPASSFTGSGLFTTSRGFADLGRILLDLSSGSVVRILLDFSSGSSGILSGPSVLPAEEGGDAAIFAPRADLGRVIFVLSSGIAGSSPPESAGLTRDSVCSRNNRWRFFFLAAT